MKIKKTYEVSGDGRITIYPSLYEIKEKSYMKRFLNKVIHFILR